MEREIDIDYIELNSGNTVNPPLSYESLLKKVSSKLGLHPQDFKATRRILYTNNRELERDIDDENDLQCFINSSLGNLNLIVDMRIQAAGPPHMQSKPQSSMPPQRPQILATTNGKLHTSQITPSLPQPPQIPQMIPPSPLAYIQSIEQKIVEEKIVNEPPEKALTQIEYLETKQVELELPDAQSDCASKQYQNGTYVGQIVNGKRQGKGKFNWTSGPNAGDSYNGDWDNDMRTGQGMLTWAGGNEYIGNFFENQYHGIGTGTWANGNIYQGEWLHGVKQGQGTLIWPSGARYTGQWENDKRQGKGTYLYPDGSRYEGSFENNKKHGKGKVFPSPDAKKGEKQQFKHGKNANCTLF